MSNYYIRNMETGKIELHFDKSDYMSLSDDDKKAIKSNFLFSRYANAWVSRCKFPNLYNAERVAEELGLEYLGKEGETLTFAEQQERKMEKAEHRAERMEHRSEKAMERGEALQKPINDMHGDIAFFTQPNINSSSGRAFTNRRNRMFAAWERGFEEFKKSEYYEEKARIARQTANGEKHKDKGFCQRRIEEAEASIRGMKRNIAEYERYKKAIENGEIPKNKYGWEVNISIDSIEKNLEHWYEVMEQEIGKSVYYHECIEALGGIAYSKENLKKGDIIKIKDWSRTTLGKIVRFGTKNITFEYVNSNLTYADGSPMQGKCAYAEVLAIVKSV